MSCGIIIKDIYFSGVSKQTLEMKLEGIKEYKRMVRAELLALAASSPFNVYYDSGEPMEWAEYVSMKTSDLMDQLGDYAFEERMIGIAMEDMDNVINDC